jgi:Domain of unknown function (DUF4263)
MAGFTFKTASKESFFENWPDDWPDKKYFADQHIVRREQRDELAALLHERASETKIEKFLKNNREVLALVAFIYSTGHHAAWIFPKALVRPAGGELQGQIPDYVLAGANSGGVSWFVLELKGAEHNAFSRKGSRVFLSREANQGVCQLLQYMDVTARTQAYLRDELKLKGFREPCGVLMIGTDGETEDSVVRDFKAAWNRWHPKLQIRSYGALLRIVDSKLRDFSR